MEKLQIIDLARLTRVSLSIIRNKLTNALSRSYWTLGALDEKSAMKTTIGVDSAELFEKRGRQLAEILKEKMPPKAVVLDFGCGIGRPEKNLSPYCRQIYGVDQSVGMLRLARRRHKKFSNIHFVKNKRRDLSIFKEPIFDFVFSEAVFQHIEKENAALILTEFYRVLKKGGRVYLNFPNLLCPHNLQHFLMMSMKWEILTSYRMRYWLFEEVGCIMRTIGFEILSLELKSDYNDKNGEPIFDESHKDYSIWVYAQKKS